MNSSYLDKTKQCASFCHILPLTKRQMDIQTYSKKSAKICDLIGLRVLVYRNVVFWFIIACCGMVSVVYVFEIVSPVLGCA